MGYSPIQIIPGTKRPPVKEWDHLRSISYTPADVDSLANQRPNFGLGVVGGFGGLVPIDIDTEDGDIVDAVCSVLPQPLVSKRGQKGFVSFYRAPEGWEPQGRKFMVGKTPIVEVLGNGKSILPPTVHPDTQKPYEWLTPRTLLDTPAADLPQLPDDFMERLEDALLKWCPRPKPPAPAAPPESVSDERLRTYALNVLDRRAAILAGMKGVSGRNNELMATVCRVGNWVHHGVISESELTSALYPAYQQCGGVKDHGRNQFPSTIKSGLRMSASDPLRMPRATDFEPWRSGADPEIQAAIDSMIASAQAKKEATIAENVHQLHAPILPGDEFAFDGEFKADMPPALIRGLLPRNGLIVDGGQSGAGKTFAEVDMAVALASGEDFFGQPVRERVGVVYIAAEGQSSIQRRFIAAKRYRKIEDKVLPIAIPRWSSINLRDIKKRIEIIKKLQGVDAQMKERFGVRLGCIIVDTVSAACPMKDENSNAEIAIVCRELREIADATDCALVVVHHFGKSEDSGLRGGSAWRANCDHSRIFLATRDGPGTPAHDRRMAIDKNRLGPEGDLFKFELAIIPFGKDIYGDDVTECAILVEGRAERKSKIKLNTHQEAFLKAYRTAFASYRHTEANGLRPHPQAVLIDLVRDAFMDVEATGQERLSRQEADAKRKAWSRAFNESKKVLFAAENVSGLEWAWPLNVV